MDTLANYYNWIMAKADDRVDGWLYMSSPWPTVATVILYLVVVIQGQKYMQDRKAFDLKNVIIVYNFFLVLLSAYMVVEFVFSAWLAPNFDLMCQGVNYSNDPYSVRLLKTCWWFYISKIIELMDTVFFVLRKKNNQVSFLHVYHHTSMPLLWWVGVKFVGGGEAYFSATINSGIHVLMYLYYLLAALGPAMQPYLWWKRYMTTLQLIQFWMVMFKTIYAVYRDCGYPVQYGYCLIGYMVSHIILFSNFYYQTYHRQARHKTSPALHNSGSDNHQVTEDVTKNGEFKNGDTTTRSRRVKRLD